MEAGGAITLPSLLPVIVILFILNIGTIMEDDFDQTFNFYKPAVYSVSNVLSTDDSVPLTQCAQAKAKSADVYEARDTIWMCYVCFFVNNENYYR